MTDRVQNKFIINKLTKTQFDNAQDLSADELYLVDPEFTGNKILVTDENGEIVESGSSITDIPVVVNNVTSTSTTSALSANMGKELQDEIDNLEARGRFLALWNCATGLPATNPQTSPYQYKSGDYYIVGTVASGSAANYKPDGSSYTTGIASTVVETAEVAVDDVYYYDGTNWKLQANTQKTVSFANIAGQPTDNTNLATALAGKVDDVTVDGTSVVSSGTAVIPIAQQQGSYGLVKLASLNAGIAVSTSSGNLYILKAGDDEITPASRSQTYKPIVPANLDLAVQSALTTPATNFSYTDAQKDAACHTIGAETVMRVWTEE